MSGAAGKWREDQVLIICPGSRTTMAQLGCSELTPPMHRIPTRMFRDGDEWRPYYTFQRTRVVDGVEQEEWVEDVDEEQGAVWPLEGGRIAHMEAFLAFLDHVHSILTTTYHNTPIMLMASPQWTRPDCETIARYIFEKTRTPALCMIHSALATQYGLKSPSMTVVDIGFEKVDVTAIHDGRVVGHHDLGAENPDRHISGGEVFTKKLLGLLDGKGFSRDMAEQLKCSTICEVLPYAAGEKGLVELPVETAAPVAPSSAPAPAAGSDAQTETSKPSEPSKPADQDGEEGENGPSNGDDEGVLDVASIVTSGQTKEFLAKKEKEKGKSKGKPKDGEAAPTKPARLPNSKRTRNTFYYEEIVQEEVQPEPKVNGSSAPAETTHPPKDGAETNGAKEDGAAAVASGEDKGDGTPAEKKDKSNEEGNGDVTMSEDKINSGEEKKEEAGTAAQNELTAENKGEAVEAEAEKKETVAGLPTDQTENIFESAVPGPTDTKDDAAASKAEAEESSDTPERKPKRIRRDIEVGLERFTFADRGEIDRIVSTIYRTVQGIDDMYMRPACWDNLVFVGNGSRLRGLKDNIIQTLNARHLISPSTATMFTSELPSNMATPTGTGSQTPTGSYNGAPHQLSTGGVNPLLQAATTANSIGAAQGGQAYTPQAGSDAGGATVTHHFHSQTPTSIKTLSVPTYLGEWTKNGFEEAMFLGAQVASRIAFCLHSGMDTQAIEAQRLMSLSRVDYNELGPKAIRTHSMLS